MILPMWAFWLAIAAMLIGLIGVVLPIIPGVGFIWLVILIYAIAEGFATIDPITFVALTILGAVGVTTDIWIGQIGAKAGGASFSSIVIGILLGAVGALFGAVFLGVGALPGFVIGAVTGVVLNEWYTHEDWKEAFKAGGGWLIGCALSGGVQLVISVLMMAIFIWQALKG